MAQVGWSPSSLSDLEVIAEFISRDSPHYAGLFVQRIITRIEKMAGFPLAGRVVPEYGKEDLREFLYESYRIVYRIREEGMRSPPWFTAQDFFLRPLLEVPPLEASVERIGCRGLKR